MLFSLYPIITKNYFILIFVICLGTLQWAAARNRKPALSFLGRWGVGRPGSISGALLVSGGFIWFFSTTPGLFDQGLAGGELSILFVSGGLSALTTARLLSMVWGRIEKSARNRPASGRVEQAGPETGPAWNAELDLTPQTQSSPRKASP